VGRWRHRKNRDRADQLQDALAYHEQRPVLAEGPPLDSIAIKRRVLLVNHHEQCQISPELGRLSRQLRRHSLSDRKLLRLSRKDDPTIRHDPNIAGVGAVDRLKIYIVECAVKNRSGQCLSALTAFWVSPYKPIDDPDEVLQRDIAIHASSRAGCRSLGLLDRHPHTEKGRERRKRVGALKPI